MNTNRTWVKFRKFWYLIVVIEVVVDAFVVVIVIVLAVFIVVFFLLLSLVILEIEMTPTLPARKVNKEEHRKLVVLIGIISLIS